MPEKGSFVVLVRGPTLEAVEWLTKELLGLLLARQSFPIQ